MNAALSPIASEFETQEQADSYDRWFRAKVQVLIWHLFAELKQLTLAYKC